MNVRTLCLGALVAGDATGYEIRKMFEEGTFSFFQQASLGSIYPALTKLAEEGLVTFSAEDGGARPDKKVYRLTEMGREEFRRSLITARPGDDQYKSDIIFMLCFSRMLPKAVVELLLDEYLRRQKDELTRLDASCHETDHDPNDPGARFIQGLGVMVHKAIIEHIETQRGDFLKQLDMPEPGSKEEPAA